jgi:hypothetical protein
VPDARPNEDAWIERIAPALAHSTEAASHAMTNHPAVQAWLQEASFQAAMGLEVASDVAMAAEAYARMLDDLTTRFAALEAAVRTVTDGCGRLDLRWRPLSPQYSTLSIDFGVGFAVARFFRLADLGEDEALRALHHVAGALPKGEPFPNRPNVAAGVVVWEGRCVGVRVREHAAGEAVRRRTYGLYPKNRPAVEALAEDAAVPGLLAYLQRTA